MAKVKYGEMIAGMSGSIRGSTHSRNRGGNYMRNRAVPVNPNTVAQAVVRTILGSLSAAWRGLTQSQRDAWKSAASNFPVVDQFGDQRELSGHQLFVKLNGNLLNAGGSQIDTPPMPVEVAGLTGLDLSADVLDDTFAIDSDLADVPSGTVLVVEATAPQSAGISNAKNKFRKIGTVAAGQTFPVDQFSNYTTRFGALQEGTKVFVRCYLVNLTTGQRSQRATDSAIVVDTTP